MLTDQRLCPREAYLHTDEVSTQTGFRRGPAGKERSKVETEVQRWKQQGTRRKQRARGERNVG